MKFFYPFEILSSAFVVRYSLPFLGRIKVGSLLTTHPPVPLWRGYRGMSYEIWRGRMD